MNDFLIDMSVKYRGKKEFSNGRCVIEFYWKWDLLNSITQSISNQLALHVFLWSV